MDGDGGLPLYVSQTEKYFKIRAQYTQLHGVLDMKAWLNLICFIVFEKRSWAKLFISLEILNSLHYIKLNFLLNCAEIMKSYFTWSI